MAKDNLDYIVFAIKQVHEALEFGFSLNHCCRNLNIVITQYWEKQTLGLSVQNKPLLPKSKEAQKQFDETGKLEGCIAEHSIPKNIIVRKLLEKENTKANAKNILEKYLHLLVITKEEDDKLRKAKLFKNMPDDWDGKDPYARYKKVGIELC